MAHEWIPQGLRTLQKSVQVLQEDTSMCAKAWLCLPAVCPEPGGDHWVPLTPTNQNKL